MTAPFHELTALQVKQAVQAGELSPTDYIKGLIARIEARDPDVDAWASFDPARALAAAAALERRGDFQGLPLAGVAVGVKDVIDTADMPTENGTPLDAGRRPAADARAVRLLRDAGAIILGKTVTTELAFMHPSKTRNPHRGTHTPGGSSAGSAAAVAAAMVPIALGTQTNGSVIRPASFCGVYGIKPTHGLFSTKGVLEEAPTFDTVGVFARSLEDLAALAEVLAGDGPAAGLGAPYLAAARAPLVSPRYALIKTPTAWTLAEDAAKRALERVAAALGAACEEVVLPADFDRVIEYHRTVMFTEMALNYARYYERGKDRLSAVAREAIEAGRAVRGVDYAEARGARERLYEAYLERIGGFDAVLALPASGPAPAGLGTTGNPAFCTLWTYLGVPALNLPMFTVDDLPLGLQVVGRRLQEAALFSAAASLMEKLSDLKR